MSLEHRVSGKDNQFLKKIFVLLFCCFLLLSCSEDKKSPTPSQVTSKPQHSQEVAESETPKPKVSIIPPSWLKLNVFKKSDMPEPFSVKIGKELPEFTFTFHGKKKRKPKTEYDFFYLSHIEVMDASSSKVIQKIEHKDEFSGHVDLLDLNQDGYLDLMVTTDYWLMGRYWAEIHIFQPELMKFKRHAILSKLSSVSLDEDSKLIATYWRIGACDEFREYFSMEKDGTLALEKVAWTEPDNINSSTGCFKFTAIPRGNRNITDLGRKFVNINEKEFAKLLQQKVKVVKNEEFLGRLDVRYKYE